jgi:hypothetical protein
MEQPALLNLGSRAITLELLANLARYARLMSIDVIRLRMQKLDAQVPGFFQETGDPEQPTRTFTDLDGWVYHLHGENRRLIRCQSPDGREWNRWEIETFIGVVSEVEIGDAGENRQKLEERKDAIREASQRLDEKLEAKAKDDISRRHREIGGPL